MMKKQYGRHNHGSSLNRLTKAIIIAFPMLAIGMGISHAAVPLNAGQDVAAAGLSLGNYDLLLNGNVTWNSVFNVNSAAKSNISIDGNACTIVIGNSNTQRLLNITQAATSININNAVITSGSFTGPRNGLILINANNATLNLNLENTAFKNIGPTDSGTYASADYGPILNTRGSSNSVMNISAGTAGVLFQGNHGLADQPGAVGLYSTNAMNFTGKVTFDSNWTANYGGAITVYEANGSKLTFADETNFINNHSAVFGGAIDYWGGASDTNFNGKTLFQGNYVYGSPSTSSDYPAHVTDQHSRGGAINLGYNAAGASGLNLNFNGETQFIGNFVVEAKSAKNALGGAVSAYGNGTNRLYFMNFNGPTTFDGNYVYSTAANGYGYGGAIYYDAGSTANLTLGPGSRLINNYAKTLGGAIYLQTGNINLSADGGDIVLQNNYQNAFFTDPGNGFFKPVSGTGDPNAVYLGGTGSLNLYASEGYAIRFYDPIASAASASITVNKTGDGEAIFYGNNDAIHNSLITTNTTVSAGAFSLVDRVIYGDKTKGVFTVASGGTVSGNNGSTLRANLVSVNGGTIAASGGIFNLDVGSGVTVTAGQFSGYGAIAAPLISLGASGNISRGNADSGQELILDAVLTGAGGLNNVGDGTLTLTKVNAYTGATTVSAGTLKAGNTNVIQTSSGLTVNGGAFDLSGFNQTVSSLAGLGGQVITTGGSQLTVNGAVNTTYAGAIVGNGRLSKQGSGVLTLTGSSSVNEVEALAGGLTIGGGSVVVQNAATVNNGAALTVSSAGSLTADALSVGASSGSSSMAASGGSVLQTKQVSIGKSGASGTVTLSASRWENEGGSFIVGDAGVGSLSVNTGANLSHDGVLNVGSGSAGSGTLTVDGANTLVQVSDLVLGSTDGAVGQLRLAGSAVLQTESMTRQSSASSVDFSGGTLRAASDNNSFIDGFTSGSLVLNSGGVTLDSNGFTIATSNIFSGSGGLNKAGVGTLTLTGLNAYSGLTYVTGGTLRLTDSGALGSGNVTIDAGAELFIDTPTGGSYAFNKLLSGSGLLHVDLSSITDGFSFGSGVGNGFSGVVQLGNSLFTLAGTGTSALTNATLQLDAGNTTDVGAGVQAIGGLNLNGGLLRFNNFASGGVISTQTLALNSGTVAIDPDAIVDSTGNLLVQDEGQNVYLVNAGSVSGSASNLTLTNLSGGEVADSANVIQGGELVAVGDYGFSLNSDSAGLYAHYALTQLNLQSGKTLTLSGDTATPSGANELHAKLIGDGGLLVNATNTITLNNTGNIYTGLTTVGSGTLALGANGALGQTSGLDIQSGATVDLNGYSQTVGGLSGAGSLNVNAGQLTTAGSGTFGGVISGTGALTVSGGLLTLTGGNTYSGNTTVASGATLQVGNGGTSGSYVGNILNNGEVIFNRSNTSSYLASIGGSGKVTKSGSGALTLSGASDYAGGTTIESGRIIATHGQTLGSGDVDNASGAVLELNFDADDTFDNVLSGAGELIKSGDGNATLTATGSSQGIVSVESGTLTVAQNVAFNAENVYTGDDATLALSSGATLSLSDTLTQGPSSTLDIALGGTTPVITANEATIGGTLKVSGLSLGATPAKASLLAESDVTLIHTTQGIVGDFDQYDFSGASSSVDYLRLTGKLANGALDYNVGFGLNWLAGTTLGNGIFTLTNAADVFELDVALGNQSVSATGWDGKSLTKAGSGQLILSAVNGYTGDTRVQGGTLKTTVNNAFVNSANVSVSSGATLNLNNTAQQANNLSGAGDVQLGSGTLTVNSTSDSTFSGQVNGGGRLIKIGTAALTLSGNSDYAGGTSISAGRLIATSAAALGGGVISNGMNGTLQLDFSGSGMLTNWLIGSGALVKTGGGAAMLTSSGSSQGAVSVDAGTLTFAQNGAFNANSLATKSGATTGIAADATLELGGSLVQNSGATLNVAIGSAQPAIAADSAQLAGNLNVTGFSGSEPARASQLLNEAFTVIHTTNGITGDFSQVDLGGASSRVDYLKVSGGLANGGLDYNVGFGLTWLAGTTLGNGVFTLTNAADVFELDVALSNQSVSATGWDGKSLTKAGSGQLILSAVNGYTGDTQVQGGMLKTTVNNAFVSSANVSVSSGATLNLNNTAQQANNLSGAGSVQLGSGTLTVNSTSDSAFSGQISGGGQLIKTGTGALTLSGNNGYSGGTAINVGKLIATSASALGGGSVNNGANGTLQLDFANDGMLVNRLSGTGALVKTGAGNAALTSANSSQGAVSVNAGSLTFAQGGAFNADSLTTKSGATTAIAADATLILNGALTQNGGATLNVAIGSAQPAIVADSAQIAGTLNVTGFSGSEPAKASLLLGELFTVLHTANGITGDFSPVDLGGASSRVDYLTMSGGLANGGLDYNVGFGLTWLAGATLGNGNFTLANATDAFELDVALSDQSASATGWDGKSLTKAGSGQLVLSVVNGYTGDTRVQGGELKTTVNNAFVNSANVLVNSGATLNLNGTAQQANNLSGAGGVSLGNGALTVNSVSDSTFSGQISGDGQLIKTGTGSLTLSGNNGYAGGTAINIGKLIATSASALGGGSVNNGANGTLQLDFVGDGTLANRLSGVGALVKTGAGSATLTSTGSSQGAVSAEAGALAFAQIGAFNADSLTTKSGATTAIAADATLELNGSLSQQSGSTLEMTLGSAQPVIAANAASLTGELKIVGIDFNLGNTPTKASEMPNTRFTLIQTTNGITGDFDAVDLNGAASNVDFLTVDASKSADGLSYHAGLGLTWIAGNTLGHGVFTLAAQAAFDLDVALSDQGVSATGWDGKTMNKQGQGTLTVSAAQNYTGDTRVNGGVLKTAIADAFTQSANVIVANAATLNLDGFSQRLNNLSGSGSILLGNGNLTVNSLTDSAFDGAISGNGQLVKTGAQNFTLTGVNFYSGGTAVSQGRLIATQSQSIGTGNVNNNAELELAFSGNGTVNNALSGSGALIKSGSGTASLTASGSSQGSVTVSEGTLGFSENGLFTAGNYMTNLGATTSLAADSRLNVSGLFDHQGTLDLVAGNSQNAIDAISADLGVNSAFNLSGYSAPETTSAAQLAYSTFTVIHTAAPGNLTGAFQTVNLGGATSPVDYLSVSASSDTQDYRIGLGLNWYAAHTITPTNAHGDFTLTGANEFFDLDVVMADETANGAVWDGKSLTKLGDGTLKLSKANTYTGETRIDGGALMAGHTDIIAQSERLTISQGATLDMNDFDQYVNALNGAGNVKLGSARLTINTQGNDLFSGVISGSGELEKVGGGQLQLTSDQTYSGVTTVADGTLLLGNGGEKGLVDGDIDNAGLVVFDFGVNRIYSHAINGAGDVMQQGDGILTLTQSHGYTGKTTIDAGGIVLLNNAQLSGTSNVAVASGAMLGGYGGVGGDVDNQGLLAVADAALNDANAASGTFTVGGRLTNGGEIRMESVRPTSRLVVNGDYVGSNGLLTLSTVLEGDNADTDRLVVLGNTSGVTRVVVNNAGGVGAQTVNGIEVISVGGQSDGQFTLTNRVVAGAYEYSLYQGLPNAMNGNWYLRSQGGSSEPQWRPEIGGYLGNQSIVGVMQTQTLFDRKGTQFKSANDSAWGRIVTGSQDSKAAGHHVDMNTDYTLIQVGGDLLTLSLGDQGINVGLMASYGDAQTDSTGNRSANGDRYKANGSVDGYSLGMYATWFADAKEERGAYVDSWLQHGWYSNSVNGEGMSSDSYDSRLWTASLESGYIWAMNEDKFSQWSLAPQAQVVYSHYSADSLTDVSGTEISNQKGESWTVRVGSRVMGRLTAGDSLFHPYAELNWLYNRQPASVAFDGENVQMNAPKNRAEVKVGVQSEFDSRWSTWIHFDAQTGADDYRQYSGGISVRYSW
ncbi:autotransporter [Leminorella grimontii]|uniref:Autotransporter n=1 Tax=Leminorella grimontii TaxID=82981 RepID=A0AAV5MX33_9GAMM|nr:autotransporter outer membrane beta-barrel domain-containing protein [Leminorella grimontii]KFC96564.1 hypothetical protein GLGR_1742 [Leminorella grimontii ATCC 33999 = DSM 5078]GKX54235.1 autotransporter [Leminorella grimontii]